MTAKDAIGHWPKHPNAKPAQHPTEAIALATSQRNGRKRQSASESRLIRVDGKARVLRDVAREHGVPPGALASDYRGQQLNTTERLSAWASRWKARRAAKEST